MRTITVGGLPGTGTSTLCEILKDRLELPYVYAGKLFRDEAAARNMSLAEFGRLCEEDPAVDRSLDTKQTELLREGGLLLEGRLSGWMAHMDDAPAFKIWVTCQNDERIRRIADRDGGKIEIQAGITKERETSEAARYHAYYGIDMSDLGIYDLVLDSTNTPANELADQVVACLESA